MMQEKFWNLLGDDADVLVNTTNAMGVMGKGLALEFAKRWPEILGPYKRDCEAKLLKGGLCRLYDLPGPGSKRKWEAFCPKHDWRYPSEFRWIKSGLIELIEALEIGSFHSVAIPSLGRGNGGLSWPSVKIAIESAFAEKPFDVRLYPPKMFG